MKKVKKKHPIRAVFLVLLALLVGTAAVFLYFGGFGVGESADPEELRRYAGTLDDIVLPDGTQVIALGEATHGNAEFQQLKLDAFKILVERYGVKAFVLEADYGCCETVNRYIHGGEGTAKDAAAALGFPIYRTSQIAALIDWMRMYNETAAPGADLRFYGNDMQLCHENSRYLAEACERLGIDTAALSPLTDGQRWSDAYDHASRERIVTQVKREIAEKGGSAHDIHFADMLLQNLTIGGITDDPYQAKMIEQRATFMAENTLWILAQEQAAGHDRILVSAHNGHVARYASAVDMGALLHAVLGDGYYVIGTGYFKTRCNLPVKEPTGKRTTRIVFSHDPLGNAGKKVGLDSFYLDFATVPASSSLTHYLTDYHYLGSLGEGFSFLNRLLPMSTREFQPPATLFNAMFYVTQPAPTAIE